MSSLAIALLALLDVGFECTSVACKIRKQWTEASAQERWHSPMGTERATVQDAVRVLVGHADVCSESIVEEQNARVRPHGFRIERWHVREETFVWVREEGGAEHGAGLFVIRCGPADSLLVQVPQAVEHARLAKLGRTWFSEQAIRAIQFSTLRVWMRGEHPLDPVHVADGVSEAGSFFHAQAVGAAAGHLALRVVQLDIVQHTGHISVTADRQSQAPATLVDALASVMAPHSVEVIEPSWDNVQFRALGRDRRFVRIVIPATMVRTVEHSPSLRRGLYEAVRGQWW